MRAAENLWGICLCRILYSYTVYVHNYAEQIKSKKGSQANDTNDEDVT